MKALIIFCALFSLPLFGFSQSGIEKLKALTNTLTQPQDTSKPQSTGTESKLAVSDEGAGGGKPKSTKKTTDNPIDKLKKNLTGIAVENNNTGSGTGTGTSNLAVSDEGAGGTKGKSSNKETPATGTGTTTPTSTEVQPKTASDPK